MFMTLFVKIFSKIQFFKAKTIFKNKSKFSLMQIKRKIRHKQISFTLFSKDFNLFDC